MAGCNIERSCTKAYPYPFTEFPIYIFNDNAEGSASWSEIFPEATIITDFNDIFVTTANDNRGALVIRGSSFSPLCRDLLLNNVIVGAKISAIKKYNGFFIDDFFNPYPFTVEISDITPRQFLQLASDINLPLEQRSFWISSASARSGLTTLESQFYPALVVTPPPFPQEKTANF